MRFENSDSSGGPAGHGRGGVGWAGYINVSFLGLILGFVAVCWMGTGCDLQPACSTCGVTKWTKFSPANERYSVFMPCKPEASAASVDTAVGPVPASMFFAKASKGYGFAVMHCSLPCSEAERAAWYEEHDGSMPVLVAESGRDVVAVPIAVSGGVSSFTDRGGVGRLLRIDVLSPAGQNLDLGIGPRECGGMAAVGAGPTEPCRLCRIRRGGGGGFVGGAEGVGCRGSG
jgi:hypothetical protein